MKGLALVLLGCLPLAAQDLSSLSRRFLESSAAAHREALVRYAVEHRAAADGTLAYLVLGIGDYQDKRYAAAWDELAAATERATELADYAVYYRALTAAALENHTAAADRLAGFAQRFPTSPLVAGAQRQYLESLSLGGRAREALDLLPASPQTAAEWTLAAQIAERAGEKIRAAQAWQRVYYEFPAASEQAAAKTALAALRAALGPKYPGAPAGLRLTRADRLVAAGQYTAARAEYRALSTSLKGLAREQAAVRSGACDYHLKADLRAWRGLQALVVKEPDAAAERLYYLAACARRLKKAREFTDLVTRLGRDHPAARWHEEALFSAGNYYFLENEPIEYQKYYRTLVERFPQSPRAVQAHWKLAWRAYLDKSDQARRLFEDHLRLYPDSPQATAAVYWLARLAQGRSDLVAARALYQRLVSAYPHYYHALLAGERLAQLPPAVNGPLTPETARLLALIPPAPAPPAVEPPAAAVPLLRRARLLGDLGLHQLADRELRFRAEAGPLAYYAGFELAQRAAGAGAYHQAIRFLKRYTPGYLGFRVDALPRQYWELLFPLPWRREIEAYSQLREVDPYLVAALIRQESEFNPGAISRARARGLMQIVYPTGRRLGRSLGLTRLSANQLYVPDTSLRLGILHLRRVLDQYDGKLELALAGYNAGEHRVDRWKTQFSTADPAEFVENIPFTETRGYVQAVLRNAALYRKLYGS